MKNDSYVFAPLPDQFRARLVARLDSGGPLGELLARKLSGDWRLSAILPTGVSANADKSLEEGGMASSREAETLLASRIARHLNSTPASIAIFEDDVGRRGDAWIAKYDRPLHYVGDRVYHVSVPGDTEGKVLGAIRKAASARLLVGMVAASSFRPAGEFDHEELRDLAESAVAIIADAFDGETFVVAERAGSRIVT